MKHEIELTERSEEALRNLAGPEGNEDGFLAALAESVLAQGRQTDAEERADLVLTVGSRRILIEMKSDRPEPIRSTEGVVGGDACIRNTRIPVWMLVEYKRQGLSDRELLANYPNLSAQDLIAAWEFYASHSDRVDRERRQHEEAA